MDNSTHGPTCPRWPILGPRLCALGRCLRREEKKTGGGRSRQLPNSPRRVPACLLVPGSPPPSQTALPTISATPRDVPRLHLSLFDRSARPRHGKPNPSRSRGRRQRCFTAGLGGALRLRRILRERVGDGREAEETRAMEEDPTPAREGYFGGADSAQ